MKITLTDAGILELYQAWSEGSWVAGFMHPSSDVVSDFRVWLHDYLSSPRGPQHDYELEMLDELHKQEMEEPPLDYHQS